MSHGRVSFISTYRGLSDYLVFDRATRTDYRMRGQDDGTYRCLHENLDSDPTILPRLTALLDAYFEDERKKYADWCQRHGHEG